MFKYIFKRVLFALLTIFIVSTLTFSVMFLIPGGPFLAEKAPSAATLEALNKKYGLDQPKPVQYRNYIARLMRGDMGVSLKQRGRTVNEIIAAGFPVSARLGGMAVLLALFAGVAFGSVAAYKRGKTLDNLIMIFVTMGISVPGFVVSTVLLIIFGVKLKILPTLGLETPKHYILPVLALSLYPMAYISRLCRSSMLDVLGQDYMRTARAKGLSSFRCLFKHALRNAILPVVTYLGPMLAYIMTGSFVIEKVFTIPGVGNAFITSTLSRDYPLIMGTTIFLAALIITMNVVVDILYKVIDPRIKLGAK
ncbi:MAG: ABC transporter permease [Clostridiales bacterium]|jgi:oligopeptide transport system permease protein|nr:ABC transporter permease [Clostridiales bacterium]